MMTDAPDRYVNAVEWTPGHDPRRDVEYLRATPARLHAEELFEALRALVASDEPWSISCGRAQALIASIEGKKP